MMLLQHELYFEPTLRDFSKLMTLSEFCLATVASHCFVLLWFLGGISLANILQMSKRRLKQGLNSGSLSFIPRSVNAS